MYNNSIFIACSNSKLLSNEFLNELSERLVSFKIKPFVFKEIVEYSKELGFTPEIGDYLYGVDSQKDLNLKIKKIKLNI